MTKRGYVHSEEQYLEMYARLALEPEDFRDTGAFLNKLRRQLWYEPTGRQVAQFTGAQEMVSGRLAAQGIRGKYIPSIRFGPPIRYYISGLRGGYSWARARAIWEQRAGASWL